VFALYPTFREVTSKLVVQRTILQYKIENSSVVRNNCSDARERLVPNPENSVRREKVLVDSG
jgi:hypothetical protein